MLLWCKDLIRPQFCTSHDSSAVMACAKLGPALIITIIITAKRMFIWRQLWAQTAFVKCVPSFPDWVRHRDISFLEGTRDNLRSTARAPSSPMWTRDLLNIGLTQWTFDSLRSICSRSRSTATSPTSNQVMCSVRANQIHRWSVDSLRKGTIMGKTFSSTGVSHQEMGIKVEIFLMGFNHHVAQYSDKCTTVL